MSLTELVESLRDFIPLLIAWVVGAWFGVIIERMKEDK